MKIELRGGWEAEIVESDGGNDIVISNPTSDGGKKFFEITSVGDPYGAPRVIQEPALGIPARDAGIELDANIVGFIIVQDGKVVERASLSNLTYMKDSKVEVNLAGELMINDEPKGFIQMLLAPDKNRLIGYVGYVGPNKPEVVAIEEMETIALRLLG